MTPDPDLHDPAELGAHVLGLLDSAAARTVEEHIDGCSTCRRQWEELREMAELLGDVPPEAFLDGPPDGDLVLQRTMRQMRAETSVRRRRRRLGVAVAAVTVAAALLGGGVLLGRIVVPPPSPTSNAAQAPAGSATLAGAGADGIAMSVTVTPAAGWVRLQATVSGIPPGESCRLVVVAADGSREVAGSWLVPPTGWSGGVSVDGSAAVAPSDVVAVVVENAAGREFVRAT